MKDLHIISETVENTINELIDKMNRENIGRIRIKDGDFELELESKSQNITYNSAPNSNFLSSNTHSVPISTPNMDVSSVVEPDGNAVKCPIVGTFYSSSASGKDPFVTIGKKVCKGDILFIVESMKLMNEVKSEFDGIVSKILVKNGEPLEYGQKVMIIE